MMTSGKPRDDVDLFGRRPRGRPDWSHRRGEPRGLALAWAIYLMLVTIGSLTPAMSLGRFEPDVYRPAARTLMVLVVVGLCVLWPMLRLTQPAGCRSPGVHVAKDLVVVVLPAMTLVWPQLILADWPLDVLAALTGLLIGWAVLFGALLVWWRGRGVEGVSSRLAAMCIPIGLVALAPLVLWRSGLLSTAPATQAVTPGWMWTPVTSVWEVLRDRGWSGRSARIGAGHWIWIIRLLVLSCGVFALSIWSCRRGGARLPDPRTGLEN